MKTKTLISIIAGCVISSTLNAQIDRVEPPFWWTAMQNPQLQLMVHGKDISRSSVIINHKGIIVKTISRLENPNYLFLDLELTPDVQPGFFEIQFFYSSKIPLDFYLYRS